MKDLGKFLFILCISSCYLSVALAKSDLPIIYFNVNHWQIDASFGKTVIGDVAFDAKGRLVLASSAGVKKFNGQKFSKLFSYDSQTDSNSISRIQLDSKNQLWGINRHGLIQFLSNKTHEFKKPISFNIYSAFIINANDEIWFVTDKKLYTLVDKKISNIAMPFKATSVSYSPYTNNILVGTVGSVAFLNDSGSLVNQVFFEDKNTIVYSVFAQADSRLIVDTNQGAYLIEEDSIQPFTILNQLKEIRKFYQDSKQNLWIATNYGIYVLKNHILYQVNVKDNENTRIRGIVEDEFGNIWFGTWSKGLYRLKATEFKVIPSEIDPSALLTTTDGALWVGGFDGASYYLDNKIKKIWLDDIDDNYVKDFAEGLNGNIWIAYRNNLVRLNKNGMQHEAIEEIDTFGYYFLLKDLANNLWVGTTDGVFVKDLTKNTAFVAVKLPNKEQIRTIDKLGKKQLLFVSNDANYIYENGNFIQNNVTKIIPKDNALLRYDNKTKSIWYVSPVENTLNKIQDNKLFTYKLDEILRNFTFYNIGLDTNNNIILLTENGILRVRHQWIKNYTQELPLFYEMLALPSSEYPECNGGHNSLLVDSNKNINMTCKNMVLVLKSDSENAKLRYKIKQLAINKITIADTSYHLSSVPNKWSPDTRSYEFSFSSNSIDQLLPIKYRYKLEGSDRRWHYDNNQGKVNYIDLKPGHYSFEVQARTINSAWQSSESSHYKFEVEPYFYQKSWFITLVSLLVLSLYFLNNFIREMMHKRENFKLSHLVEEKTKELKEVQKRELQREQQSRQILNAEIETKSKELEKQMLITLDKEKQLQETQKMEIIGQLTSGIAHDFNNMLSVIFIGSEIIKRDLEKNSSDQYENIKWLNNILLTAENCKEVIGQLLSFTRKDNDKNQIFCVYDALSDILSLIKIGIPNAIQFNMNFSTEPAFINADLSQFNQIILNLIINARNACGDYGEITITTAVMNNKNSDSCISCQQYLKDFYLEIVISDTGTGIHKDLLEHIFKPFFSTNSNAESTGIGLHIVNTNVHKMNGHIQVLPNDDKGMSFIVLLPLVKQLPIESTLAARSNSIEKTPKKVLLVEDSSSLIELISLIFEENNISYDVGKNGLEGIDLFFQNPDKYDLVLTDNSMPEMNGIDMSKHILAKCPDTNIVLLTGDINDEIVDTCAEIGISEIFLKPIKFDELIKLVNSYTKKITKLEH